MGGSVAVWHGLKLYWGIQCIFRVSPFIRLLSPHLSNVLMFTNLCIPVTCLSRPFQGARTQWHRSIGP